MFTGIIEEIGKVRNVKNGASSSIITIEARTVLEDTKLGDSIAVNGVCLTVTKISDGFFDADVMAETLRRSNIKSLKKGDLVNLERAMKAGGRFGGHIVSGHIDDEGIITNLRQEDNAVWVSVECAEEIMSYVVLKGSIAIDGISLTVADIKSGGFSVSVIPHTRHETTLLSKNVGDSVNIECDILAKYVQAISSFNKNFKKENSKIDINFLSENGFM